MIARQTAASVGVNITTNTDTTLVAGQPGKIIKVWQLCLENIHATTDDTLTFKSNATAINGGGFLLKAAGGGLTMQFTQMAWMCTAPGDPLVLTTSAAGTITGIVLFSVE